MTTENLEIATYKQIYDFIYNKGKALLACKCGAGVAYIGKCNFQNKNYDVLQAKGCECHKKANPIPFLDKNFSHFKFSEDNWNDRKNSESPNLSQVCVVKLAIPAEPVYKMMDVDNGKVRYTALVPMTEVEKIKYYDKAMRSKRRR